MKTYRIVLYALVSFVAFSCQKEYSVEDPKSASSKGSWEFTDAQKLYFGNMDTAYIDSSNTTKQLHLIGRTSDGSQTFHLQLYASSFSVGEYKASLFQSSLDYASGPSTIYNANQLIGEFIVNVTTYGNNTISGTFSGAAVDSAGNNVTLTLGKFTAALQGVGGGSTLSSGVLGDSSGTCKPVVVNGTYTPGTPLDGTNTIELQVTVATPGTYTISSPTVNGISFSGTGTFSNTGPQTVTLNGGGTPSSQGVQNFTVSYGNSQCSFSIIFGNSAVYTLGGSGGDCAPLSIGGVYQQGIILSTSNTVQIGVTATVPGDYLIKTDTVNGVSFSASGTFASAGFQSVVLAGSGIPVNEGVQNFIVTTATGTCNFSITFLPGVAPSGDYFPTTIGSNWTFSLIGGTTADSVQNLVINYSPTISGNSYSTITTDLVPPSGIPDSSYYRKPGGDYYQYINYSYFIPFDQTVVGEFVFLKDNVAAGTTWQSPNISGTVAGVPLSGYIKTTLVEKAVPVTIGTFNFPDVIKVKYEFFIAGSPTVLETDTRWFARNIGEIHFDYNDGFNSGSFEVGRYQIF